MSHGLFDLTGKTAAIIGGGSGIGEAIAIGAAAQGATVVVLDANAAAAQAVAARIPTRRGAALDIRDAAAVGASLRRHRRATTVGSTSWSARRASTCASRSCSTPSEEFDRVVELNLKGSFNVLQAAGRVMTAQRSGSIVIFSSIRAQVVEPGQSVYAMTKSGILQLVRAGAAEFGPFGVRVNAVGPGVVETPLTAPIRANAEWYDAYANKSVLKRWARADEMVGPDAVSGVGRRQLRDRHDSVCRRRMDGGRRPLHAARDVTTKPERSPRRRDWSFLRSARSPSFAFEEISWLRFGSESSPATASARK